MTPDAFYLIPLKNNAINFQNHDRVVVFTFVKKSIYYVSLDSFSISSYELLLENKQITDIFKVYLNLKI